MICYCNCIYCFVGQFDLHMIATVLKQKKNDIRVYFATFIKGFIIFLFYNGWIYFRNNTSEIILYVPKRVCVAKVDISYSYLVLSAFDSKFG